MRPGREHDVLDAAALTVPGDHVLDNVMGSGTTGVACIRLGRRFTGIEMDPGHFQVASERLAREVVAAANITAGSVPGT